MQTLDDFLATIDIGQVALVKVDVEGSELKLFRGARQTLKRKSVLAFVVPKRICESLDTRQSSWLLS